MNFIIIISIHRALSGTKKSQTSSWLHLQQQIQIPPLSSINSASSEAPSTDGSTSFKARYERIILRLPERELDLDLILEYFDHCCINLSMLLDPNPSVDAPPVFIIHIMPSFLHSDCIYLNSFIDSLATDSFDIGSFKQNGFEPRKSSK